MKCAYGGILGIEPESRHDMRISSFLPSATYTHCIDIDPVSSLKFNVR